MRGKFSHAAKIGFAMAILSPALFYGYKMKTKEG